MDKFYKPVFNEHYLKEAGTLDSNNMCLDPGLISDNFGSKLRVTYIIKHSNINIIEFY
jgi:hypothetical protein